MKQETIKVKSDIKIEVPRVPNFIKVNGMSISVGQLSEKELRLIGKAWVKNLIARSEEVTRAK